MGKDETYQKFWESFGIPAYDELTVPDNANMPYITYAYAEAALDEEIMLTASLWYHDTGWGDITQKAAEIAERLATLTPIACDTGRLYIKAGAPFSQRMGDDDPHIRRILLTVGVEFFTPF